MHDLRLPAEAIAAVTGMAAVLEENPRPVTAAQGGKAASLPKLVKEELEAALEEKRDGNEDEEDDSEEAYWQTLRRLTSAFPAQRFEVLTDGFLDRALAMAYQRVVNNGVVNLQHLIPRSSIMTITGHQSILPSRTDLSVWRRIWSIANDPLVVLRDLRRGRLVFDQVDALQLFFPALYDMMQATLLSVIAEKAAEAGDKWDVPRRLETQLGIFLDVVTVAPELVVDLQAQDAVERGQEARRRLPVTPLEIDIKDMALPGQRLAARARSGL